MINEKTKKLSKNLTIEGSDLQDVVISILLNQCERNKEYCDQQLKKFSIKKSNLNSRRNRLVKDYLSFKDQYGTIPIRVDKAYSSRKGIIKPKFVVKGKSFNELPYEVCFTRKLKRPEDDKVKPDKHTYQLFASYRYRHKSMVLYYEHDHHFNVKILEKKNNTSFHIDDKFCQALIPLMLTDEVYQEGRATNYDLNHYGGNHPFYGPIILDQNDYNFEPKKKDFDKEFLNRLLNDVSSYIFKSCESTIRSTKANRCETVFRLIDNGFTSSFNDNKITYINIHSPSSTVLYCRILNQLVDKLNSKLKLDILE